MNHNPSLLFLAAVTILVLLPGCVSTQHLQPPPEGRSDPVQLSRVNARAATAKGSVRVHLADKRRFWAHDLRLTPDTTSWSRQGQSTTVPTQDVRRVVFIQHGRGALGRAAWGFLAGGATMAAVGAGTYEGPGYFQLSRGQAATITGLFYGVASVLPGALVGAAFRHRERYDFRAPDEDSK